jgi:two-component sensor histidine kinase
MPEYVHELVDSLDESFNASGRIRFNLDIEPMELDLAHCIPLGLILNETITNSFKYAFPANKEGMIAISFKHIAANRLLLTISDDGIGLPAGFNAKQQDSMGMHLMRGLSEEIGAGFGISGENGTTVSIDFVYDRPVAGITPVGE